MFALLILHEYKHTNLNTQQHTHTSTHTNTHIHRHTDTQACDAYLHLFLATPGKTQMFIQMTKRVFAIVVYIVVVLCFCCCYCCHLPMSKQAKLLVYRFVALIFK